MNPSRTVRSAITLRNTTKEDADLMVNWFNDKDHIKYMSTYVRCIHHTKQSIIDDIEEPEGEILLTIMADDVPIGHGGFDHIDEHDGTGEIYFLIGDHRYKGQGLGKEIVRELLKLGFTKYKLHNILATVAVENMPSLKCLESNGFKRIGIRREMNDISGRRVDEILMDILPEDFEEAQHKTV